MRQRGQGSAVFRLRFNVFEGAIKVISAEFALEASAPSTPEFAEGKLA